MRKLDGGLSTALESRGNIVGGALWTGELLRSAPHEIEAAHQDFVDAGAQIITTSAYQLSFPGCRKLGWNEAEITDALELSTQLARKAAGTRADVAASVGPYGAALADGSEYRGNYGVTSSVLRDFHKRRLEVLIRSKPDLLAIETMPDIAEVEVILDLISQNGTEIPFWVSYSCKEGALTNANQSFHDAVALVGAHPNAIAVGINCTAPEFITPLLSSTSSTLPFVIYPNAGRQWDAIAKTWVGAPRGTFDATRIGEWIDLGAEIIGGCCGVSPQDIARMDLSRS
ncbi:MAG: homocysteine S-methyltransferase [Actinobacteria bacterium]|nr:homocysteine S-methyltransferase [Actinomycetota bacterium]